MNGFIVLAFICFITVLWALTEELLAKHHDKDKRTFVGYVRNLLR